MSSPRKHPSLYPSRLRDLVSGPSIEVNFPSALSARNFRYQFYAFREALRKHPRYAPELLVHANNTRMELRNHTINLIKRTFPP